MIKLGLCAIVVSGVVGCGAARAPSPPPVTTGAPAATLPEPMQKLAFYQGEWDCEGVDFSAGASPEKDALHVTVVSLLGGKWLSVSVSDKDGPSTTELKGFDPKTGNFRHLWGDIEGTSGSLTSVGGWDGNRIVLVDDNPKPTSKTRMVFTKVDERHFTHVLETDVGKGFQPTYSKSCTKAR